MQVEIKKPSVVDFNKIEVGELFYANEKAFMKIKEFEDSDKTVHNAISLSDGKFAFYGSMDRVNRANGKLVITLV